MPELPEVETVVRELRPLLVGRTIASARQSKRKLRRPWKPAWNAEVVGVRVEGLRRRGKWILIDVRKEDPTPQPPPPGGEGEKESLTSPLEGEVAADSRLRESSRRVGGEASEFAPTSGMYRLLDSRVASR